MLKQVKKLQAQLGREYFVGQHCNRRQHAVQQEERSCSKPATRWCLCCVLSFRAADVLLLVVVAGAAQWPECVNTGWQMKCVCVLRVCVLHVVFVVATLVCGTLRDPLGVAAAASLPWGAKCVAIYGKDRTVLYVPMCLLSNYVRTIWKICLHILHKLSKSPRGQWLKSNRKWNKFRGIPNINIPKNMAGFLCIFQCRSKGIRLVLSLII